MPASSKARGSSFSCISIRLGDLSFHAGFLLTQRGFFHNVVFRGASQFEKELTLLSVPASRALCVCSIP